MTFSRRHLLTNSSATLALPALASLGWNKSLSAQFKSTIPPKRMIFLGMGFGVTNETWYPDPKDSGKNYQLPKGLKPLKQHKSDFSLIQNCYHQYSNEAHWGSTFWLTGANRYAIPGQSFSNSISVDQVAAKEFGKDTRFSSLQLTSPDAQNSGHGPGLSLAWDSKGKPLSGIDSPLKLFHKLFSADQQPLEVRQTSLNKKLSVMDALYTDAKRLKLNLCQTDNQKLDEYFESIRDIELQIQKEQSWMSIPKAKAPTEAPQEHDKGKEEIRLMLKIIKAALQTDSSRVLTYRLPLVSLLRSLGTKVHSHDMSHYSPGHRKEASEMRDTALSELLSEFIDDLKNTKEVDGSSLFDHSTLVMGSNIRSIHYLNNCPTLISGGGSGIKLGYHHVMPENTPLCNVWLSLLRGSGIEIDQHGDSTGVIRELFSA